jgi:UDP-N-acetylmuramate dehydrogenase
MKKNQVALAPRCSLRLGGLSQTLWQVANETQLLQALAEAKMMDVEPIIVGAMTNVVWVAEVIPAVIQLVPDESGQILVAPDGHARVWAGEMVTKVARATVEQGWSGWENFVGLPGTVGGAVWNNAHFGADLMSERLAAVRYLDLVTGEMQEKATAELGFGYDQSWFQGRRVVIVEAILTLSKSHHPQRSADLAQAAFAKRQTTQPLGQFSAGCWWRNPDNKDRLRRLWSQFKTQPRISAGFIIEQAGLKGKAVGGARVSERHAAFIINDGTATIADVTELTKLIQREVWQQFEIKLQPEVVWYPPLEQVETELFGDA